MNWTFVSAPPRPCPTPPHSNSCIEIPTFRSPLGHEGGTLMNTIVPLLKKYQQPQICRWYHSNGRKWRRTKDSLDEGERGECKSWLKPQHSKNEDHGIQFYHCMVNRRAESRCSDRFSFLGLWNHCGQWLQPWN